MLTPCACLRSRLLPLFGQSPHPPSATSAYAVCFWLRLRCLPQAAAAATEDQKKSKNHGRIKCCWWRCLSLTHPYSVSVSLWCAGAQQRMANRRTPNQPIVRLSGLPNVRPFHGSDGRDTCEGSVVDDPEDESSTVSNDSQSHASTGMMQINDGMILGLNIPAQPQHSCTIALSGMACRTAGAANSTELWQMLLSAGCALTRTPPQRWIKACTVAGAAEAVMVGGFVELAGCQSVPTRWGFSVAQSQRMDVHLTLLIHTHLSAVCDAQLPLEILKARSQQIGVFTACTTSDFLKSMPSYFVARIVATALQVVAQVGQ